MFLFERKPAKPNYTKAVVITLAVVAAAAALGYMAYKLCKKKRSECGCDDCCCCDDDFFCEDEDNDDVEVEMEGDEAAPENA